MEFLHETSASTSDSETSGREDISLRETLDIVQALEVLGHDAQNGVDTSTLTLNTDGLQGQHVPILYQPNLNTNFEDRNGFVVGIAKYLEEAAVHAALEELLAEGEQHAVMLYTWRSCSRGIPQPKSNEDPNRREIYSVTVDILKPEVEKLFRLVKFQKNAVERFCEEVRKRCHPEKRKEFIPEEYLLTLGKFINMFAILDELKNIKASVKNDYSAFKRAAQFLGLIADLHSLQEFQNLSMFLATQDKIRTSLKGQLARIENFQGLLLELINICVSKFEAKAYVTPKEKHMLVKVVGFALDLIDSGNVNIYKLDQKKKIRIEKIDKMFHTIQVVPLYGDMQISPFSYVNKSQHFDASKWPLCSAVTAKSKINPTPPMDIVQLLPEICHQHLIYIHEINNLSTSCGGVTKKYVNKRYSLEEENAGWSETVLKGVFYLCEWSSLASEVYAWKLHHPTDHHLNRNCPSDAEEYERATRFNYSDKEKCALVHLIAAIKGLQGYLSKLEPIFAKPLRQDIYQKLQAFVQITLREPIRKAVKHKKDVLRSVLMSIRETCADWLTNYKHANQDPVLKGEKDANFAVYIDSRGVGPSSTQLYLMRTMLESIISEKTCAKKYLRKDVERSALPEFEEFHKLTSYWSYLLNFSEVLEQCCDLSQLWYREFYLEMTMGARIQFPIRMSLPWILIEYLLENPSKIEHALFAFDLYNDSGNCALTVFRKQFLYDELEAEVNLCFDQFVGKLGKLIFSHCKTIAATNALNKAKEFQKECANYSGVKMINTGDPDRYVTIARQRCVQLLGHNIDLNKLIRQRVSLILLTSMQEAIKKFEDADLTSIVELDALHKLNRETHKLLQELLPGLDDFENMWREADETITDKNGRTQRHIISELHKDILANYCYNGTSVRFVKFNGIDFSIKPKEKCTRNNNKGDNNVNVESEDTAATVGRIVSAKYLWGSKQHNIIFSAVYSQYSGFIGQPHFDAIAKLLGYDGLAGVLQELLGSIIESISEGGGLNRSIQCLKPMMPTNGRMPLKPLTDEESPGMLAFYMQLFQPLIQCPEVKLEICKEFRKVGNALILCLLLEKSLAFCEIWSGKHGEALLEIHRGLMKEEEEDKTSPGEISRILPVQGNRLEMSFGSTCDFLNTFSLSALSQADPPAADKRITDDHYIFSGILTKIKDALMVDLSQTWSSPSPENKVMHVDDSCTEYHRLWSALQFVFCIPVSRNEFSIEELFGDGLNWGGCLLIVLLDQQRRFEAFDFSTRLRLTHHLDGKDGVVKGIRLARMMARIRSFHILHSQIFALLNEHLNKGRKDEEAVTPKGAAGFHCFEPPFHSSRLSSRSSSFMELRDPEMSYVTPLFRRIDLGKEIELRRSRAMTCIASSTMIDGYQSSQLDFDNVSLSSIGIRRLMRENRECEDELSEISSIHSSRLS